MKGFLRFLLLVALIVGAWGFFKGWFSISTTKEGDHSKFTLDVDNNKLNSDLAAYKARLQEKINHLTKKASDLEAKALTADDKTKADLQKEAAETEKKAKAADQKLNDSENATIEKMKQIEQELDHAIKGTDPKKEESKKDGSGGN